jgi:hypothetical protein
MKRLIIIIISICTSVVIGQTYCAGDQISNSDLNTQYEVCYGSGDYETGDSWSLADYDGSQNGGNYHIIFMDMSATW